MNMCNLSLPLTQQSCMEDEARKPGFLSAVLPPYSLGQVVLAEKLVVKGPRLLRCCETKYIIVQSDLLIPLHPFPFSTPQGRHPS